MNKPRIAIGYPIITRLLHGMTVECLNATLVPDEGMKHEALRISNESPEIPQEIKTPEAVSYIYKCTKPFFGRGECGDLAEDKIHCVCRTNCCDLQAEDTDYQDNGNNLCDGPS